MTRYFLVILGVTCDDEDDDPRRWPWDDLLQAPDGEAPRYVSYKVGVEEVRP